MVARGSASGQLSVIRENNTNNFDNTAEASVEDLPRPDHEEISVDSIARVSFSDEE